MKKRTMSRGDVIINTLIADILFDGFSVAEFQKEGTKTAQLRQLVTTESIYPSKRVSSDMQDNLFSIGEFGFENQTFTSKENRMAFLTVPQDATEEVILEKLKAANAGNGCIYKVLSNKPILDNNQQYAAANGIRPYDDFAASQVLRFPKDHATTPGQLILDKAGNLQYRRTYFSLNAKEDVELRDGAGCYVPEALTAEYSVAKAALVGAAESFAHDQII